MKILISSQKNPWLPDFIAESVNDIDFDKLKSKGIKACFFDLDHTLLTINTHDISPRMIEHIKSSSLDLYIATNRQFSEKLDHIAKQIEAKAVMHAASKIMAKPNKKYYKKAVELTGFKPEEIAMIGDRVVQDIWGAKRAGLNKTVLVHKLGPVKWYDKAVSGQDYLLPITTRKKYKDL